MATKKGKEDMAAGKVSSPTQAEYPDLSGLNISMSSKHAAPPRPPPMSKRSSKAAPPPPQPPRPSPAKQNTESENGDEDDDDPFADRNVVDTPRLERGEPRW